MKNVLMLFFILLCFSGFSQISFEKRIEFELNDGYEDEKLFDFGSDGFIIQSQKKAAVDGNTEWRYEFFNPDLQMVDFKTIMINKGARLLETNATDSTLHSFYKLAGNYTIISVIASNLERVRVDGKIPKHTAIMDMAILGDYAWFKANKKSGPFIFQVNWKTGEENIIPIQVGKNKSNKIVIRDIQLNQKANEVFVYVNVPVNKQRNDDYVIILNAKGETLAVINLTGNFTKSIVQISASKFGEGKYIFTGTYSPSLKNKTTADRVGSEGLFFCRVDNGEVVFMKTYNFLDLKNFLTYLPERQQEKIEKKKEKKEMEGKELSYKYSIAGHEVIPAGDGFIFLGEAYYSTTRSEQYAETRTSTFNGQTTTTTVWKTRYVFDGYQYTHAVLAKFDTEGNLLWDQCFEMWPSYKPMKVKRFISIADQDMNSVKMVFTNYDRVITKSFNFDGTVISDTKSEPMATIFAGDNMKQSDAKVDFWYDNYFLAYGTQIIKNSKDDEVKGKRKVYFISKIKFE